MSRLRSYLSALSIAFAITCLPGTLAAQADTSVNVSGKWQFAVTTDQGTGTPTVTFEQKGDSLTGHYSSRVFGEKDFKGAVKGRKITFAINVDLQGTALVVNYRATAEPDGSLKGDVDVGGQATGTFTAKRL